MYSDQSDHRLSSTPLFYAIPTGTYTRRNIDARTNSRAEAPYSDIYNISEGKDKTLGIQNEIETDEACIQPLSSITKAWQDDNESLDSQKSTAETIDPILYRETTAVANGSMTLLSKQPAIEAPQTGAKGRAREREARRSAVARIMPSQSLIVAAKMLSGREGSGRTVLYPLLTNDEYLVVDKRLEEGAGIEARVRNPDEVLLVGCSMNYEKRSRERGFSLASSSLHLDTERHFVVDGKGVSEDEACQFLACHPGGKSWGENSESIPRERERSRLLKENALLKRRVARFKGATARHREEDMLRDENERLRTELQQLKIVADGREITADPSIVQTPADNLAKNENIWNDAGLGNQPRRSANRGNRVGASLMSQEVMIEHPSAGKGRAREREERRRLQNLAREQSRSYYESGSDEEWYTIRRANWRTRAWTDSEDETERPLQGENDRSSNTGNLRNRKAEIAAAPSCLPPDVLTKYGPNRPSRIWREHNREILVEAANGGGSRGRRREIDKKHERGNEQGEAEIGTLRLRQPRGLVQAMKTGVSRTKNEDESAGFDGVPQKPETWTRDATIHESLHADFGNEDDLRRGRSPHEALAKYATDRPSRMFRDGSCEVLLEGDVAGRRRRVERAHRRQLPEPRFMPSQAMADAAAKMGRGENAFLLDDKEKGENNKSDRNDSADE